MPSITTLFDIFSANLELYKKEYNGLFMCPLCLRKFSREQIGSDLSRSHIIPRFLGGKDWTLACRACNSKVGAEIECCENERVKFHLALAGNSKDNIGVNINVSDVTGESVGQVGASVGAVIKNGNRSLTMSLQPNISSPTAFKLLNKQISNTTITGGWSAEASFRETRSIKRANLTYIHTAYMLMFHQFGYEWVLSPGAEPIRKQIMAPDDSIILPLSPALSGLQIPDDELAIILVTEPEKFRLFLVVLPMIRGWSRRHAVWIPLFGCLYEQPPTINGVELAVERVPSHHQFLHEHHAYMQGARYICNHFNYHPAF